MKIRISNKPIEYPKWLNPQSEHISNSLVPFLDMFNHKTGVKNKIQVWTDEIELRINEEISSEEEIFIDYGPWVILRHTVRYIQKVRDDHYRGLKVSPWDITVEQYLAKCYNLVPTPI